MGKKEGKKMAPASFIKAEGEQEDGTYQLPSPVSQPTPAFQTSALKLGNESYSYKV